MENAAKQAISSDASKQGEAMPSGYRTIAPYIIVPRAGEFIEFLVNAFGGTERFRVPREPGSEFIMHAEVAIGNSVIELADANEQIPAAPMTIHLYADDADSVFAPGPEGVPSVQPYLHLRDSEKMIPFLENAFGGVVQGHVPTSPEGHVLHATIQIGDNTLELDEAHGEFQRMPCHLHLHVDDADAMYARALRAGATSIDAPSDKPYGRSGGVKDPFGNSWYMTSPLPGKS